MNDEENKKVSFLMFYDWEPLINMLDDAEAGRLTKALFAYEIRGEVPDLEKLGEQAARLFSFLSKMFDENKRVWKAKRDAGMKGGKASGEARRSKSEAEAKQNEAEAKQNEPKVKVKVKVKEDKERDTNVSPKKTEFSLSDVSRFLNTIEIIKDHPEIKEIIYDFYKMRKAIKKPLATESALRKIVNDAIKLGDGDPEKIREIFENSVANSWQGVFPLKEEPKGSTDDYLKRKMKEAIENDRQNGCDIIGNIFTGLPVTVQQDDGSR